MIQFLAGAPELLARYRNTPPAAAALIDAAMDARRLGMGAGLPQAFLEAAAPGYLTDDEWDALGEDWLEQGLAYTAVPCKGARGPLTRIRPRPARPAARDCGDEPASVAAAAGPLYWLADYLDQHGRAHRAGQIPPAEFWSAAAAHAAPGDQAALGDAAHARGLYRDAAQLHKNAAVSGRGARGNMVDSELGVGLVYTLDEQFQRLDLWQADHAGSVSAETQLQLLRQVAEAVAYAHGNRVVHRGLTPHAVWVHQPPDGDLRVLVGDWRSAGTVAGPGLTGVSGSGVTGLMGAADGGGSASVMKRPGAVDVDRRLAEAFQAPEGVWNRMPNGSGSTCSLSVPWRTTFWLVARRRPIARRCASGCTGTTGWTCRRTCRRCHRRCGRWCWRLPGPR